VRLRRWLETRPLWLVVVIDFFVIGLLVGCCFGQATVRYGILADSAAAVLARTWTPDSEVAYCVTEDAKIARLAEPRDTVYGVFRMRVADSVHNLPGGVLSYYCAGKSGHTHPDGGCDPSRFDYEHLQDDYGFIACGPIQVRFYFRQARAREPDHERATVAFVGAAFAVIATNAMTSFDHDPGGYPDVLYPDKAAAHFGTALLVTQVAIAAGVRPITAAAITSLAGAGYELSQGYVNPHDVAADVLGAAAGALLAHWLRFR
jgi:hypothetical protein